MVIAAHAADPLGAAAIAAWATGACALVAALLILDHQKLGRALATAGAFGAATLSAPALSQSPAVTLAGSLCLAGALALLWNIGDILGEQPRRHPDLDGRARGAAAGALLLLVAVFVADHGGHDAVAVAAVDAGMLVAGILAVVWAVRALPRRPRRAAILLAAAGGVAAMAIASDDELSRTSAAALLATLTVVLLPLPPRSDIEGTAWWDAHVGHPERLFVGTFAVLCLLGTGLLSLPQSAAPGPSIGALDALFTSVSAVCVTGLTVLDTASSFSVFGQAAILLLIQVGGLGIMTFSTAALRMLGRRMSLRHERAVASLISTTDRSRIFATARTILVLTFALEGVGAILLFAAFLASGDTASSALWRAVFTSVSAFCNAGFALQADSLIGYHSNPVVLHVVAFLIIAGGLSPAAVIAAPRLLPRRGTPLPVQLRVGLMATIVLLLGGFAFVLAFEWNGALTSMSLVDRLHNAWFQSATLRTAGFNSIDMTLLRPATLTLMMAWMFIGGSPGGTAGGIKTTTAAVLLLAVVQAVRGRWTLDVFGRRIAERSRHKAAVTVTLATATLVAAVVAMQLTQTMSSQLAVFEVVSALGTVGLSLGGTAELDSIGKFIIISCMFVGRVGGLTALLFLSERDRPAIWERPEEEIDVG